MATPVKRLFNSGTCGVWGSGTKNKYVGSTTQQRLHTVGGLSNAAIDRATMHSNDVASPKNIMDIWKDLFRTAPVSNIGSFGYSSVPNDTLIIFTS